MQFFLDTASLDEIHRWKELDLVDGVTTNPALLAKEGGDPLTQLAEVARLVDGPVSAQVTTDLPGDMVRQGTELAALASNIVVKVPATLSGYAAAKELTAAGIDCNITLTFQPTQAIPFARLPVAYVSLIVGRAEDFGLDLSAEIARANDLFERLGTPTKLLVASLRNPQHLCAAIVGGADVLTVPPSTWKLVYQNPLSMQGLEDFRGAWSSLDEEKRRTYERLGERAGELAGERDAA